MITRNINLNEFTNQINNKKLVVFGASVFLKVVAMNYEELQLPQNISYIVDSDSNKEGTTYNLCGVDIMIHSPNTLLSDNLEDIVLLIGSERFAYDIYKQLDIEPKLKNVPCYCLPVMISKHEDKCVSPKWNTNEDNIPKIIHCFWFSGSPKDEMAKKCMASWRKYCPDYEIIEWNAENYDLNKNDFMYSAFKNRKWAYATDYARLDAVYNYGGFYFDLDLELTKNIDDLRHADFVAGFGPIRDIELAAFGAKKHSPLVAKMLKVYENREFDPDNLTLFHVQPVIMDDFMKNNGFRIDGQVQNVDNQFLLHRNAFSPRDWFTGELKCTDEAYGIHHCAGSWISKGSKATDRSDQMNYLQEIFKN